MKILSWNVNGLQSIIRKGFNDIVAKLDNDVICIQELKTTKEIKGFKLEGYYSYYNYSKISGYSGVAIFTRKKPNAVYWGMKIEQENEVYEADNEARVLTLEYKDFYIINVYVPHPQTKNERRSYREEFIGNLKKYIKGLNKNVIICGDFNICYQDIDIYEPNRNVKQQSFIEEERDRFKDILDMGLIDTYRYMHPKERKYTLKANHIQKLETDTYGWRLDYFLISKGMKEEVKEANIYNEIEGSDHCPIELVLNLKNGIDYMPEHEMFVYIPKGYMKDEKLKKYGCVKNTYNNRLLGDIWQNFDFDKAESYLFQLQCDLTKEVFNKDNRKIKLLQYKIVNSTEARMLAVRKVSEKTRASAGIDGVLWEKASDKMRAVIRLKKKNYKSMPLREFIFLDEKCAKMRQVGIPTIFDRAMQVLYSYALEPVEEALADRRSFAFRKGKSHELAHAFIMKMLNEENAPKWFLISDITSYYDSIAHKWLLKNIPMDKYVLNQFLKSGYVMDGELFNREAGISLGCNISTLIGNMTLDGLQGRIYKLQGKKVKDYYNGYCIRFADDVCISARTKKDAVIFKNELNKFVTERGLKLSEKKTQIVNIKEGFNFLSRFYYKCNGEIKCVPSERAIKNFEQELSSLVYRNKYRWNLRKMIDNINCKISGFATYHKVEDSMDTFIYLDCVINATLLKMMMELHNKSTKNQLLKKYWERDSLGRMRFKTSNNSTRKKFLRNMADTVLINEPTIDLRKNVFLDKKYFKSLSEQKDIQNCIGRFKKVWDRQEGKCFICSKEIKNNSEKEIFYKTDSKDRSIRNMAYVHSQCKERIKSYVNVNDEVESTISYEALLENISSDKKKNDNSKFENLNEYFYKLKKKSISLSFNRIEEILGFKLCDSAYKYKSYFYNSGISNSWTSQGYEIKNVNMEKQKIEFVKVRYGRMKIVVPKAINRPNLPIESIKEVNEFFLHWLEKYDLK